LSPHHKTVLRRKLVNTPAQQSVKQANGAFGQVIAKTAQEFGLSLGLIRRQSQRVKSADLTAVFSQYAIFAHTLSTDGAHVFLCLDPIFASALIEVQTISFVIGTACVDRTPKRVHDLKRGQRPLKFNWQQASIAWCREHSGCKAVI
jgi:hypothetical protein